MNDVRNPGNGHGGQPGSGHDSGHGEGLGPLCLACQEIDAPSRRAPCAKCVARARWNRRKARRKDLTEDPC